MVVFYIWMFSIFSIHYCAIENLLRETYQLLVITNIILNKRLKLITWTTYSSLYIFSYYNKFPSFQIQ